MRRFRTFSSLSVDLGDGYAAAVTQLKFMANAVVTTEEAVKAMERSGDAFATAGAD